MEVVRPVSGVGVCGHSDVPSDVITVAVVAVGVMYVSTTSLFILIYGATFSPTVEKPHGVVGTRHRSYLTGHGFVDN